MNLKAYGRKWSWVNFRYDSSICLEGHTKFMENLHNNQSQDQDLNPEPTEYTAQELTTQLWCSERNLWLQLSFKCFSMEASKNNKLITVASTLLVLLMVRNNRVQRWSGMIIMLKPTFIKNLAICSEVPRVNKYSKTLLTRKLRNQKKKSSWIMKKLYNSIFKKIS